MRVRTLPCGSRPEARRHLPPGVPSARSSGLRTPVRLRLGLLLGGLVGSCSPGEKGQQVTVVGPAEPSAVAPGPTKEAPALHEATPNDLMLVEAPPPPSCGDGALNDDEQCDDGNKAGGDGRSAPCLA